MTSSIGHLYQTFMLVLLFNLLPLVSVCNTAAEVVHG